MLTGLAFRPGGKGCNSTGGRLSPLGAAAGRRSTYQWRRAASVRPSARSPALEPRRFSLRQCHTRHPPRRNDPFRRDLLRPVRSRPQRILFPVDAFLASTVASTGGRITEPSAGVDTERRLTPLWQRESATSSRHTTKQLSTRRRRRLAEGQGHTTASARHSSRPTTFSLRPTAIRSGAEESMPENIRKPHRWKQHKAANDACCWQLVPVCIFLCVVRFMSSFLFSFAQTISWRHSSCVTIIFHAYHLVI